MRLSLMIAVLVGLPLLLGSVAQAQGPSKPLDFSDAMIAAWRGNDEVAHVARMLQEEIAHRTGIIPEVRPTNSTKDTATIVVGIVGHMPRRYEIPYDAKVPEAPESYAIHGGPQGYPIELR